MHYIKANKIGVVVATTSSTGSKHSPLLSSSAYFKFSSHVLCMCLATFVCFLISFEDLSFTGLIEDLSFFFDIKHSLKRKTYSIHKEETSVMILKSFSYKVVTTDMSVCITIT